MHALIITELFINLFGIVGLFQMNVGEIMHTLDVIVIL